jgi:hypothetical protein
MLSINAIKYLPPLSWRNYITERKHTMKQNISNIIFLLSMAAIAVVIIYHGYHTRTYPAFGGEWLAGAVVMAVAVWAVTPGEEKR